MPYPEWRPGMIVTAERLAAQQWQEIVQGSTTTITNSTALVDTNIIIPLAAGATYFYRLIVAYTADDAADIRLAWTAGTDQSVLRAGTWGIGDGATGGTNSVTAYHGRSPAMGTQVGVGGTGTGNFHSYHEEGTLTGGTTDGAVTLQAAQRVAHASDTVVQAQTRLRYLRVG